jgi:hypothetical protein
MSEETKEEIRPEEVTDEDVKKGTQPHHPHRNRREY